MRTKTFKELVLTRTVSPSTHPRLASDDATDFLLASALSSPTDLAASRWKRRSMRPIDICHPFELRAPAPRAFPTPHATFAAGMPHGVFGSMRLIGGPNVSRRSFMTASADRIFVSQRSSLLTHNPSSRDDLFLEFVSVGVVFPRR